jgi:pimeloyl-ACP methyl ester carboxylesterase
MTFLLIHGGGHSARCWEPLVPLLDDKAIAIDLPGRGSRPGPLDEIRIADCVSAVLEDLHDLGDDVVLVGHSMAGLTIPGVLEVAHQSVRHVVFISCAIPPDGDSLLALLPDEIRALAESQPPSPEGAGQTPEEVVAGQTYDMNEEQRQFTLEIVVPEASLPIKEPIDLAGLRRQVPRTWIKLLQDRSFPPEVQDAIAARADCTEVIELDSGHMAMISHPNELASILNRINASTA